MKKLHCRIIETTRNPMNGHEDYSYEVLDGDKIVSTGVSSSPWWVKHDAGGFHTKEEFDKLYPDGWEVEYDFGDEA